MAREIPDEERDFLRAYDPSAFERPSVAVDAVVLAVEEQVLRVVLVQRAGHPFKGAWALPGGFVGIEEGLEEAVRRNLVHKAGLSLDHLEQLYTFGAPGRDPRLRVITVAWLAVVRVGNLPGALPPGVALAEVRVDWEGEQGGLATAWGPDGQLPLAFDHDLILGTAVQRVRGKISWTELAFAFLPEQFTLRQLRLVYETLLGRPLNKDSFRRTVLSRHGLVDTGLRQADVGHRPAALYTLSPRR
jgi:8-oxo-dGTP diphosphatase